MPVRPVDHGIFAASGAGAARAGYFGGGQISGGTRQTKVEKFAFPDETRTALGTGLAVSTHRVAAMANWGPAGYFGGGYDAGAATEAVDKFAFAEDSRTTLGTG